MADGYEIYYKVRDVVRQQGHSETETCRVFKDWHIELRVGSGHVSVWTSQGMVYLTMLDKPVHYKSGAWEEHLSRIHMGRPVLKPASDLREILRAQAMESEEDELAVADSDDAEGIASTGEMSSEHEAASHPEPAAQQENRIREADAVEARQLEHPPTDARVRTETGVNLSESADVQEPEHSQRDARPADENGTESAKSGEREYVFSEKVILIDEDDSSGQSDPVGALRH